MVDLHLLQYILGKKIDTAKVLLQSIILKFQPQQELENIFLSTSLETKRNSLTIS